MNWKKKAIIKTIGASVNALALVSIEKAAAKAFDLFCSPRAGQLREKDVEFLKTATRWVDLSFNGDKIQCYEWEGAGKKVLLAHGWESNSARWRNLIKSLQKADFHVIAMDAPAHGGSGAAHFHAARYAQFMDVVVKNFQPNHIVAHSVGGFATLYFLTDFENKVEKAISLGAPSDLPRIFESYWDMMGYSDRVRNAMSEHFIGIFGKEVAYFQIREIVKSLKTKGMIIHDRDDLVCRFADGEAIHQNWENSTFMITEKLGHSYQDKKVYHAIRDFLKD
jgi:pimeloyl-ACP methyl ester carboxylesterase